MPHKYPFGLMILVCLLFMAWMAAPGLSQVNVAIAEESPLPGPESPLPEPPQPEPPQPEPGAPPAGESGTGSASEGFVGNAAIELSSSGSEGKTAMRIRTQQINVGWWDVCGRLQLAPTNNGYADIPAEAAEISIPGDVTGQFSLADWTKTQRSDGEWVLRRVKTTQSCES